ncbi:MAG: NERD domain-containing protein [Crenarchaeota archaeon]|nr:NERD domain-containing protein [Thermoproteota archaeon]MDW8034195.1 nuclease-related domain-containing protein [Nitrososphaerota archaeon]
MPGEPDAAFGLRLLKRLIEKGPVICKDEAIEYWEFLRPLLTQGFLVEDKDSFRALPECYLLILQYLLKSGFNLEKLLKSVNWRGFERVIAEVFLFHGFRVIEHFRFRIGDIIREIDLLVETPALFISIECKKWVKKNYSLKSACRLQLERSKLLLKYLAERNIQKEVYPLVVTFLDSEEALMNNCIVVPVWKIGEIAKAPEVLKAFGKPVSF